MKNPFKKKNKPGFENRWADRPLWQMVEVDYIRPKCTIKRRLVNIAVKHEMENRYLELSGMKKLHEKNKKVFPALTKAENEEMSWIYKTLLEMNQYAQRIQKARDTAKLYPFRTHLQTGSIYRKSMR